MGRTLRTVPVLGLLGLGALVAPGVASAATFTVTRTADDVNSGSLRWAINEAEGQPGRDDIEFDIAGPGPHTLVLGGDLPTLSDPVTIDAYTETGARRASGTRPADLMIAIDAAAAQRGLDIGGDRMTISGLAIHSAQAVGIYVEGDDNVIAGNNIGTNVAGDAALPNADYGLEVFRDDNVIGGSRPADRNVIAGNGTAEVWLEGGSGHEVRGNRIGTSASGNADLGTAIGVLGEASGNVVSANLISGEETGVELRGNDHVVESNLVGTNAAGTAAVPNTVGIHVEGGDDNLVGGSAAGQGNVISGNTEEGVLIDPASTGNDVQGNVIGLNKRGTSPIPNAVAAGAAVTVVAAPRNTIGGREAGAGNVIAGNEGDGVFILGVAATGNLVLGNMIGTDAGGTRDLGNRGSGVQVTDASGNDVGTTDVADPMNTIAHNGDDGVTVSGVSQAVTVVRNRVFDNGNAPGDLGIDLAADGLTANDALDADTGSNALQNHPVVTTASGGSVTWTLDSAASTMYRLDFYASTACDASGSGEGEVPLGSLDVSTDRAGHAEGTTTPPVKPAPGQQVTMTATRKTLLAPLPFKPLYHETSELSPCVAAS